jgi:uncharacterized protein
MTHHPQYRSLAKVIVALVGGAALGLSIGDAAGQPLWLDVVGAMILLAFVIAAYELGVASLTWVLGRTFRRPPLPEGSEVSAGVPASHSQGKWEQLRAPQALALLAAYLAGQVVVWLVLAIVAAFRVERAGAPALQQEVLRFLPAGVLISVIVGAASVLLLYRWKAQRSLLATAREELGWGPSKPRHLVLGFGFGLALAAAYLLGAPLLAKSPRLSDMGILSQLASAGGLARAVWAFAGVILGPPLEEFLFRGVLFSGLARSWGRMAAVLGTTVIFALLHLPEVGVYWPAAVSVTLLGLATALIRARTGRIVPCIATHCAYNLTMVLTAYGMGLPVRSS